MKPIALAVSHAHKRFAEVLALDDLSFTLTPGQWVALLGPNGAGKTTLMHAIASLVRLDAGTIELTGERLRPGDRRARRLLGLVPQRTALYESLSARENLLIFGRLHGIRGEALQQRVRWALQWSQLAPRADEPVADFSGGMKRRLNIACGVLHEPQVVLLDEPTVGVDFQARRCIWEMLEDLRRQGAAILQSTHQLEEVQLTCDRVLIMDHGRIIADGDIVELARAARLSAKTCRLVLDRAINGCDLGTDFVADGATVTARLEDVAGQLEVLLPRLRTAGADIRELRVEAPTLTEIFTHLTGSELRE